MSDWGYQKSNGPHTWAQIAPAANGKRQSPIDITPSQAKYDKGLKDKPLHITYNPAKTNDILNNGKSLQVTYDPDGSSLTGGPLKNKYQIAQFHFHWGKSSDCGSEHTIDGNAFAAEAHLVHYNTDVYNSFADAAKAEDGLCVLGAFIKAGAAHDGMQKLVDRLSQVKHKDSKVPMKGNFDPACLLPSDISRFWTYPGSLTTPPCFESVTWIVFKEPIEVSEDQLKALRSLVRYENDEQVANDEVKGHIVDNFRPTLPVEGRTVRSTFHYYYPYHIIRMTSL